MAEPFYSDESVTVYGGDCLDVLRELPDASVDAVCTDPPYGLEFMGKEWDRFSGDVTDRQFKGFVLSQQRTRNVKCPDCGRWAYDHPGRLCECGGVRRAQLTTFQAWCEAWAAECLRVLKPGGHLLAFGGTRTWHRLTCAIEDAGFDVRDTIAWLYGSGFPKSLDVSKAIDKARDDREDVLALTSRLADLAEVADISRADVDEHMGTSDMGGWWLSRLAHRAACPSVENWTRLRAFIPGAAELDAEVWRLNGRKGTPGEAWEQREVVGQGYRIRRESDVQIVGLSEGAYDITAPATDDAKRWAGFGTALKPSHEPIVVARKPLTGTVASNVQRFGTGALNIDATRVAHASDADLAVSRAKNPGRSDLVTSDTYGAGRPQQSVNDAGRWPTNVVLSHQPLLDDAGNVVGDACADGCVDGCPVAELDRQSGVLTSPGSYLRGTQVVNNVYGASNERPEQLGYGDSGGASRFFPVFRYEAKADSSERPRVGGVAHPTVKPLALMRWLVRLVTPPGGVVLDPFAGSGTTAEACVIEGFRCIAIEREPSYLPLIQARLAKGLQPVLELDGVS